MPSRTRSVIVVVAVATASALRPPQRIIAAVPATVPRAAAPSIKARAIKATSRALAVTSLALALWPTTSWADDAGIDEGLASTQAFLSSISKPGNIKKGDGITSEQIGMRAVAKETAPEIAAADSLLTKKGDSLTADIQAAAAPGIGSEAPVKLESISGQKPQKDKKRETPAWVTYEAPAPEVKEAPPAEPAEPTFTITPKKDDASLKATGEFFSKISKKGTVKRGDGITAEQIGMRAAPKETDDTFDALTSKVTE